MAGLRVLGIPHQLGDDGADLGKGALRTERDAVYLAYTSPNVASNSGEDAPQLTQENAY